MSLGSYQSTVGKTQEWCTPQEIIDALGSFDLDPCAPVVRPWNTAKVHYTVDDDGLNPALQWFGRVWLNPPFNRYEIGQWLQRLREHGDGIALVAARTETKWFYDHIWGHADAICFMRGRPHFCYVDGSKAKFNSGAPICLVGYGNQNVVSLQKANLGHTVLLNGTFQPLKRALHFSPGP